MIYFVVRQSAKNFAAHKNQKYKAQKALSPKVNYVKKNDKP